MISHVTDTSEPPVRAESFSSALQPRTIGGAGLWGARNVRVLFLERGEARFQSDVAEHRLDGPMVAWVPWTREMRLRLAAGSHSTHLLLGPQALSQALRHIPEAAELTFLAERLAFLPLTGDRELAEAVSACFRAILAETRQPGQMSASVINAQLGLLLVHLFRAQAAASFSDMSALSQPLARRFVTLVEANFRDRWTVARYATALDMSRDRLGDVCTREFGRGPGALIRARLMLEARRLLESSALSVDQIGGLLGFASAPQFNRFFKTLEGVPPGRFRALRRDRSEPGHEAANTAYDWP